MGLGSGAKCWKVGGDAFFVVIGPKGRPRVDPGSKMKQPTNFFLCFGGWSMAQGCLESSPPPPSQPVFAKISLFLRPFLYEYLIGCAGKENIIFLKYRPVKSSWKMLSNFRSPPVWLVEPLECVKTDVGIHPVHLVPFVESHWPRRFQHRRGGLAGLQPLRRMGITAGRVAHGPQQWPPPGGGRPAAKAVGRDGKPEGVPIPTHGSCTSFPGVTRTSHIS